MLGAIVEESPPVVEAIAGCVADSVLEWLPVAVEVADEDWLGADDGREVPEVDEGEMMPAMPVLVVSDDSVADVCEVPVPPDELRVDEGAVGDSVAVELSVECGDTC